MSLKKLPQIATDILTKRGCPATDFEQIALAYGKTVYTNVVYGKEENKERITAKEAREILGEEGFWCGLERSAFHWDTSRNYGEYGDNYFNQNEKKIGYIRFDSRKLFECFTA